MKSLGLILLLLLVNPLYCAVYKWTDSSGDVHFSDKPHPGAEKIDLPEVQTFSAPPVEKNTGVPSSSPDIKDVNYKKISIIQPADQATIRNNQGMVSVIVQIEPELQVGDKLQLIYDGTAVGEPQKQPLFSLKDVYRGSHTISVQVLDKKGKVLGTSQTVTFFMHQARVGMGSQSGAARR